MYLTYEDYQTMGGTLDEAAFGDMEFEAASVIDWHTFGRLRDEDYATLSDDVKKCVFRLIQLIQEQQALSLAGTGGDDETNVSAAVASQSNDGVSVSYNVLGAKDALLARSRRIVRENLRILDTWVQSEPRIHYSKPQAGTTALVSYVYDLESYEFCERMYHATGAFVTPGDCFEMPRSFRVGYASDQDELREGLAAVSAFLRQLEKEERA